MKDLTVLPILGMKLESVLEAFPTNVDLVIGAMNNENIITINTCKSSNIHQDKLNIIKHLCGWFIRCKGKLNWNVNWKLHLASALNW